MPTEMANWIWKIAIKITEKTKFVSLALCL